MRGIRCTAIIVKNTYDIAGNLVQVEDGKGQVTRFEFDAMNRNTLSVNDPKDVHDWGSGALVSGHNSEGADQQTINVYNEVNLTKTIGPDGREALFQYDVRHRMKSVSFVAPDGTSDWSYGRGYEYDKVGNIEYVTVGGEQGRPFDPSMPGDVKYEYDELYRVTSEHSNGRVHSYGYDVAGNRRTVRYSDGAADPSQRFGIDSDYDALGRLVTMVEDGDPLALTTYAYDAAGNTVAKQLPNGIEETRVFDGLGRVAQSDVSTAAGDLVQSCAAAYDIAGNVVFLDETYGTGSTVDDRTVSNTYDRAFRLKEETISAPAASPVVKTTTTYTYDKAYNRIGKLVEEEDASGAILSAQNTVYDFESRFEWDGAELKEVTGPARLNQLAQVTLDSVVQRTFAYTDSGAREYEESPAGGVDIYQYDFEDRLVALDKGIGAGSGDYAYSYDYRTRRVVRDETPTGGAQKVAALSFSDGLSVQEFDGDTATGALDVNYVRGSGYGGGVGGMLYSIRGGGRSFAHSNARGDITCKTDSLGSVTWQASYEADGTRDQDTSPGFVLNLDRQRGNTKDEDPTGLLNEGMRYRDLEAGVFITRDPAGFVDGPNLYAYVRQNPWTKFDPLGLKTIGDYEEDLVRQKKRYEEAKKKYESHGWLNSWQKKADKGRMEVSAKHVKETQKNIQKLFRAAQDVEKYGGGTIDPYTLDDSDDDVKGLIRDRTSLDRNPLGEAIEHGADGQYGPAMILAAEAILTRGKGRSIVPLKSVGKGERIKMIVGRIEKIDATNADAALRQVSKIVDSVEDAYSGVKKVKSPGKAYEGRMYGPRSDSVTRHPDGSITAKINKGNLHISADGKVTLSR